MFGDYFFNWYELSNVSLLNSFTRQGIALNFSFSLFNVSSILDNNGFVKMGSNIAQIIFLCYRTQTSQAT